MVPYPYLLGPPCNRLEPTCLSSRKTFPETTMQIYSRYRTCKPLLTVANEAKVVLTADPLAANLNKLHEHLPVDLQDDDHILLRSVVPTADGELDPGIPARWK